MGRLDLGRDRMGHLDARDAALFAGVALVLILAGGVMVAPGLAVEQRASALAALFAVLALIAYRARRRRPGDDGGP